MIDVKIISLGQETSFVDGETASILKLELPNGKVIKALVADETAQQIIDLFRQQRGLEPSPPRPRVESQIVHNPGLGPPVRATLKQNEDGTIEFGGDANGGELFLPVGEAGSGPTPPPMVPPKPKVLSVTKDDAGYPVVRMQGGVDPGELMGQDNPDEDGVGSI